MKASMRLSAAAIAICASLLATPVFAQGSASTSTAEAESNEGSSDIIVTANKREERALDVAGAISAFRGEDLLASGQTSFKDIAGFTPGLQANGNVGSGTPIVRGLSQGIDAGAIVGLVVNGAPIGASSSFATGGADTLDLNPIDIQRVEVLKGPQGTLYGANTLGGLLSYTLADPNLNRPTAIARGELNGTENGGTSYSVQAAGSVPLATDVAGLRVSGFYDRRAGFVDNSVRNITDQNSNLAWGVNGSLLFKPNSDLRIMLTGFYQQTDTDGQDTVIYDLATRQPRNGDLQYNDYLYPKYNKKVRVGLLTVDYNVGFATVSSATTYQHISSANDLNATNGALTGILAGFVPLFGGPAFPTPTIISIGSNLQVKKFTQELRLTSSGDGPLQWIVGGYFTDERNDYFAPVKGRTPTGGVVPTLDPSIAFGINTKLKEYSGFANLTYAFSDTFDITGGIRIGRVEQVFRQTFSGSSAAGYNALLGAFGLTPSPADTGNITSAETVKTYLATARYHFSKDGMIFARFSTGFRPGGPNLQGAGVALPPTFSSDQTQNFEGGLKAKFWDGRGSIDVTGYYLKWKDILLSAGAGGVAGYVNGGDARVFGVESALTLRPVAGLDLAATLAYSEGEMTRVTTLGAGSAAVGDPLPYNPKWSGSLSVTYRTPVGSQWTAVAGATARFVGDRQSTYRSSTLVPEYILPSYSLFDIRAGLESDRVDIDLFIRNLTDSRAQLAIYSFYGLAEITVQRPRTVGAAVTFRY